MKFRRLSLVVVLVLGLVGLAGPSLAGPPGTWTVISGGGVANTFEPGMFRTADGNLHVAIPRHNGTTDSIDIAHVSPTGGLIGRQALIDNWSGLTYDPDMVAVPGGGVRLLFGGLRTTVAGEPYNEGYIDQATSDPTAASWTLQPNTAPAVAGNTGYASYGTGATALADGTPVTAYVFNTTMYYQVGAGPMQQFEVAACCMYYTSLASDGVNVWAAWYANGNSAADQGTFVRQIYPVLGPVMQAPGSVSQFSGQPGSLNTTQAVAMVARAGGGVFLAYLKGYPNTKAIALWKLGTSTVKLVPESKDASHVAMSAGPAGRLWLAWDSPTEDIRAVRTGTSGLAFGAVQQLNTKGSPTVYNLNIEGSAGRGDVLFNDSTRIWHQQVYAGLTLKADPSGWNGDKSVEVKFKVTDAGLAVEGAKVKALGMKCTTESNGVCKLTFPKMGKDKFTAKATMTEYAPGFAKLKVK
jgi:hypothetical protein